jgi:excisionase family DNA binding protein
MLGNEMMPPMLTVREVARLLNVHANTARRWADKGILRAYRISGRGDRRFKWEDIDRFLVELNRNGGDTNKAYFAVNGRTDKD